METQKTLMQKVNIYEIFKQTKTDKILQQIKTLPNEDFKIIYKMVTKEYLNRIK